MPYNDNQIFYAALWWATTLDGAEAWTDDIFRAYGKKPIALEPVKLHNKEYRGDPVTQEQFRVYFGTLYRALKDGETETPRSTYEDGVRFVALRQAAGGGGVRRKYGPAVEKAAAAAGIDLLAHATGTQVWLHDNGQTFTTRSVNGVHNIVEFDFPGRKPQNHATQPMMKDKDFINAYGVTWETFYRSVPLAEGQAYKSGYTGEDGKRYFHDNVAAAGESIIVANHESTVPLKDLTDEEIINGSEKLTGSLVWQPEEFKAGYADAERKISVEATDDPRIVRHLSAGVKVMEVTSPVAVGFGSSFQIARPGDKIIAEKEGYSARVIRKENIDNGKVRFIRDGQNTPPASKAPEP